MSPESSDPQADLEAAVLSARDADAILDALARLSWFIQNGSDCPSEHIPTVKDLLQWLPGCPESAWYEVLTRIGQWPLVQDGKTVGDHNFWLAIIAYMAIDKMRYVFFKENEFIILGEGRITRQPWSLTENIEIGHRLWLSIPEDQRSKHHLVPLISAWVKRPVTVSPETRHQGILPHGLLPKQPHHVVLHAENRSAHGEINRLGSIPETKVQLPLAFSGETVADVPRPPPLMLTDRVGFDRLNQGRGARLDKRLLIHSLLAMPLSHRKPGGRYELRRSLRRIRDELFPASRMTGRSSWKPSRHGSRLIEALEAMTLARVRLPSGGFWAPALVRQYPDTRDLNSEVRIELALPEECDRGPRVYRPQLYHAGTISDPAYDLWLGLAYYWDSAKAANGGHRIYATRPKARRDNKGRLLDANGRIILRKNGTPVRDWRHKRAVLEGKERHPQVNRMPVLTPDQLLRMAYPTTVRLSQRRKRLATVRSILHRWECEELIVTEPVERNLRVLEVYLPTE